MRTVIFAPFLIANLQSIAFGKTLINEKNCTLCSPYKLSNGKGVEYIVKTRTALNEKNLILGKNLTKKGSEDCSAKVSDHRREVIKTKSFLILSSKM